MAVNGRRDITIPNWLGLQTFGSAENLSAGWWISASNVVVTNDGSAACLRSPLNYSSPVIGNAPITNIFNYDKSSENVIFFDSNGTTYSNNGGINTAVMSTGDTGKVKYLTINNYAYRLQGSHSNFNTLDGTVLGVFENGISRPIAAPTAGYVIGGTGDYEVGLTLSYAYRNTVTGHVSQPSDPSIDLGPTTTDHIIRVGVVSTVQTGVDVIVFFLTVDGGAIRYLLIDEAGDPIAVPNNTGNVDIDISTIFLDTGTPETSFNFVPPSDDFPNFMFKYGNRLCLCDFRSAENHTKMQYSANEVVYYGVGTESWPPQNAIYTPNKGDAIRGGIETPIGALLQGEEDSYLIRGFLTDKVNTPTNNISITESIQSLGWSIGTKSPFSTKITPFGAIWFDQNKRIQLWAFEGFPQEAGLPIRQSLAAIDDDDASRFLAEGEWFQHGKDGGLYLLTASVSGTMKQFGISIYRDPESNELRFGCSLLDTGAQSLAVCEVAGRKRLFQGGIGQLQEILDLDVQGSDWATGQSRFFTTVVGNDSSFTYYHSMRFDVTSAHGLAVTISNLDGSEPKTIELINPPESGSGGPVYALLDTYGYRKIITFSFSASDTYKRVVQNLLVVTVPKARVL